MVAGSVRTQAVTVLRRRNEKILIEVGRESVQGWRADEILTSWLFDLPTSRNVETESRFVAYSKLLKERGADDPEVRQMGALVAKALELKGEGVVDRETHSLLKRLVVEQFRNLDETTREQVIAKASLMLGGNAE